MKSFKGKICPVPCQHEHIFFFDKYIFYPVQKYLEVSFRAAYATCAIDIYFAKSEILQNSSSPTTQKYTFLLPSCHFIFL